ncbi:MAG: hypothetical protein LC800_06425 [Acidobacteria bacterium]|nr:hypothetical protein [Acidobacteriota bacterium]
MPEKKSQYDTDPLDPDFARNTEEVWGATRLVDQTTSPVEQQRYHPESEAPTRRIDDNFAQSYPSVFAPPAPYQPPPARTSYGQPPPQQAAPPPPPFQHAAQSFAPPRNVAGIGIPERYANALPYAPFYIGLVASIIELLVVPRAEVRTRFHAAQGMALQLGILAVGFVLGIFTGVGGFRVGSVLFSLASLAFLIFSMLRVWNGREHRLAPLDDATRFLNERIDPRK